jgi:hypothetical protein
MTLTKGGDVVLALEEGGGVAVDEFVAALATRMAVGFSGNGAELIRRGGQPMTIATRT